MSVLKVWLSVKVSKPASLTIHIHASAVDLSNTAEQILCFYHMVKEAEAAVFFIPHILLFLAPIFPNNHVNSADFSDITERWMLE